MFVLIVFYRFGFLFLGYSFDFFRGRFEFVFGVWKFYVDKIIEICLLIL